MADSGKLKSRRTKPWADNLPNPSDLRQMKRDAVIRQAALLFREQGFHGTSMTDLAIALGLTKAALYRYIRTKDEVLFECFKASERLGDMAIERARLHAGSSGEKLRIFVKYFVEQYLQTNAAGPMMVDLKALLPKQRKEIIQGRDRIDQGVREIIKAGIADGSIATGVDPKLASLTLMGSINWIPTWFSTGGKWSAGEVADGIISLFLSGLAPRNEKNVA